jgi:hypothetical protein
MRLGALDRVPTPGLIANNLSLKYLSHAWERETENINKKGTPLVPFLFNAISRERKSVAIF